MTYLSRFTSHFSRIGFLLPLLAIMLIPATRITATAEEEEATPYYGDWENAHGDKLQITSGSIQVNEEKPIRYDRFTMSIYKTLEDALKKQNEVKHVEWSTPPEEDEGEPESEPEE